MNQKISLETLLSMNAYRAACPPREGERSESPVDVFLHPHQRVVLQWHTSSDIGYGLHRSELLAEAGVFDAEHDSKAFAQSLFEALADKLSLRNMEDLREVFDRELAAERERRAQRLAELSPKPTTD